jgi:hypothetical protein
MEEHNYKLYFLNELHFILKFHEFSSMASIPLGWFQIHMTHKIGYKRNLKKLKSNPFYFMSLCSKKYLGDNLNFEGAPLKLQTPIKSKKTMKRERGKLGGGGSIR